MSIFSETINKALGDYRLLLRKYLTQVERMIKLSKLKLKETDTYKNDISLYHAAWSVVSDIEETMAKNPKGYYAYSGIDEFCHYLKTYLSDYEIEGDQVIHRARKASRAILEAIQLLTAYKDCLDENIAQRLYSCNQVVANYGSKEQQDLYYQALLQRKIEDPNFYTKIIKQLESMSILKNIKKSSG